MVITFVVDQFGETSNGTTITAMRFAEALRKKGHEVRVLTASVVAGENIFVLPEYRMPIFQFLVEKQGMKFAAPDYEIISRAVEGSDVVHMLMPFRAERAAAEVAAQYRIAMTAAFHIQPENLSYSLNLGKIPAVNSFLYFFFRKKFYRYFHHIHCPSGMMKNLLVRHKYRGNIYAISNGVDESFTRRTVQREQKYRDKYVVLMIGRYSKEKRQDLIIKAIGASKYNDRIQLVLAGKGPTRDYLQRLGEKYLANPIDFEFLPKDRLVELINSCDLYVHSSDAESEAISCIEAFSCGLVPVISDSRICATKQFALSRHNLFESGNYESLKDRIEWFIEHPAQKEELSEKYIEYSKQFALDACVDELIKVFEKAIDENKLKWENVERETEYISSLGMRDRKKYYAGKRKYLRALRKEGKSDFTEGYITSVLNERQSKIPTTSVILNKS